MEDTQNPVSQKELHRQNFIKYSVIGVGASVALFPAIYFLWRSPNQTLRVPWSTGRLKSPPPPRRIASRSNVTPTESHVQREQAKLPGFSALLMGHKVQDEDSPFSFSWSDVSRSSAWLTFRAFSLATFAVAAVTSTSASFLVWKWDVQDMQDFHDKMRLHVSSVIPSLSSNVHRPVGPWSGEEINSESSGAVIRDEDIDSWKWEVAKERMDEAYERGGAPAWLAAAARELEIERLQLLRRRQERRQRSELGREKL